MSFNTDITEWAENRLESALDSVACWEESHESIPDEQAALHLKIAKDHAAKWVYILGLLKAQVRTSRFFPECECERFCGDGDTGEGVCMQKSGWGIKRTRPKEAPSEDSPVVAAGDHPRFGKCSCGKDNCPHVGESFDHMPRRQNLCSGGFGP